MILNEILQHNATETPNKIKTKLGSIPILLLINHFVTICEEQQLQK